MSKNPYKPARSSATGRWAGVGPYYAMFPVEFAFEVIHTYTEIGDSVLDPFAGRATSIYAAVTTGRNGTGIEINPVGWLYGYVKTNPAPLEMIEDRLLDIANLVDATNKPDMDLLPEFFRYCFSDQVLVFLLKARRFLDWRNNRVDATLMALILINLHAKTGSGLSNQMRQSKAMAPDYSVRWWQSRDMQPPDLDPYTFMLKKIRWRYKKGLPEVKNSQIYLGDSEKILKTIKSNVMKGTCTPFSLLFTSPPYYDITHYHYDQWLRLWMLQGPATPTKKSEPNKGRFSSKEQYRHLLQTVFMEASHVMAEKATLYIRTDARQFTLETTHRVLNDIFPTWEKKTIQRPIVRSSQTTLFGDHSKKPGEVDIILTRGS